MARCVIAQFEAFDIYLSPVMTAPPPPLGYISGASVDPAELVRRQMALFPYAALFNITGQPSMSVPLAMSSDGLPIGAMFTGRYADESTLFALAGQLEREFPWAGRRPPLPD